MRSLVLLEDCSDEPMEPMIAAIREALVMAPHLGAEVAFLPVFRVESPSVSTKKACNLLLGEMDKSGADRGALYMPSVVYTPERELLFRGHVVLFSTKSHLMKVSLVSASGTRTHAIMQDFLLQMHADISEEFPVTLMGDADRSWVKDIISNVSKGINLAVSRMSAQTGSA